MNREQIKEIFMASGFTIKEGQTDLKEYVYQAAETLLKAAKFMETPGARKTLLGFDPGSDTYVVATVTEASDKAEEENNPVNMDIDVPFEKIISGAVLHAPAQMVPVNADDRKRIEDMVYKPADIKTEIHRVVTERDTDVLSTGPMGVIKLTEADLNAVAEQPIQTDACEVVLGLPVFQEPKYTVNGTHIVNRATGEVIPHDEPVFIVRAKDHLAVNALRHYLTLVLRSDAQSSNEQLEDYSPHYKAVEARLRQFRQFAIGNADRMKNPDTHTEACPVEYTDEACERCMSGEGKCLARDEGKK